MKKRCGKFSVLLNIVAALTVPIVCLAAALNREAVVMCLSDSTEVSIKIGEGLHLHVCAVEGHQSSECEQPGDHSNDVAIPGLAGDLSKTDQPTSFLPDLTPAMFDSASFADHHLALTAACIAVDRRLDRLPAMAAHIASVVIRS